MILSVMMGLLQGAEQNGIAVFIIHLLVFVNSWVLPCQPGKGILLVHESVMYVVWVIQ